MPLEERIVAWSKRHPAWQRIVLRAVAVGSPISPEALGQLVGAMVAGESIGDADLEIGGTGHPALRITKPDRRWRE